MNRGLSALPVKRFSNGGFSIGPAAPSSPAIGMMGLTSPAVSIGTPVGNIGVTPMDVVSMAVPALAPVNMAVNLTNAALAAMNAQQAPAPISEAMTAEQAEAAMDAMDATVAASQEAEDAAQGLAAMNAAQAAESAEDATSVGVDSVDAAIGEAAAAAAAAADAAAADAAAAAAAGDAAASGDAGGGGDSGGTAGDAGSAGDAGGDSGGGGDAGERAGGLIKRYQYGGGVMSGMGDSSPRYSYAPLMMAEGGLAAAQKAQSMGRGQDTMLVHMTPGEVKGLQALAMAQGGSLSINPKTGLPEAGILSALLPLAAGFALGPAGFGLMSSGMAGLTVGALTTAATGSLKKGIMAGLGAYGGAGLGEGLVNAATPMESPATLAKDFSPMPAQTGVTPDVAFNPGMDFGTQTPLPGVEQSKGLLAQSASAPQFNTVPNLPPSELAKVVPGATVQPTGFEAAKSGFENVFKPAGEGGAAARARFGEALPFGTTIAAGAPLAMAAAEPPPAPSTSASYIRPYGISVYNPSGTPPYSIGDTREREQVRYTFSPQPIYRAAQGGQIDPDYDADVGQIGAFSDTYKEGGLSALAKQRKSLAGNKYYKFAQDRRDTSMEAGIEQNFAGGGALPPRFLSGGGDGMSDSIKANIDGKQEARLADGEFVVPADVVSHLGNGSSKAGAKKLYAMMDKIRKARTGRTRQAPEVNAQKYMPA